MSKLPQGWEIKRLQDCIERAPEYGAGSPSIQYDESLPRYIRITDLRDDGRLHQDGRVSLPLEGNKQYVLQEGDFLFARSGATVGKTYLYRPTDGWAAFAGYLIRFRPDPAILLPDYLEQYTQSYQYKYWVQITLRAGAQPNINATEYSSLPILLPPLAEQRKIVEILSTWDEAIALTEQLIDALERRKQGLMQRLLTGAVRFQEFEGSEWPVHKIKELCQLTAGGTPSTRNPKYWNGTVPWMRSGEIHKRRVRDVREHITHEGLANSSATLLPPHCVLVALAGQGVTRGMVAINEIELSTNQSVAALAPDPSRMDYEYLYYNLDNRYAQLRLLSTGAGGRGGLNLRILGNIKVPVPSLSEQRKIATVLSTADLEVAEHGRLRAALLQQKKGLMQRLLTGRVRVKV